RAGGRPGGAAGARRRRPHRPRARLPDPHAAAGPDRRCLRGHRRGDGAAGARAGAARARWLCLRGHYPSPPCPLSHKGRGGRTRTQRRRGPPLRPTPLPPGGGGAGGEGAMSFLVAVQFLSHLPTPAGLPVDGPALGRALGWFPVVGLVLGGLLAGADLVLSVVLPRPLVDAFLLVLLALLTGGLHLDGFMDTCDGLFSLRSPEDRLAIFRDSRVGSFGVVGAGM